MSKVHAKVSLVSSDVGGYIQEQFDEIAFIYRTVYPDNRIRVVFYRSENPFWADPTITHGDLTLGSEKLNLDYLGMVELEGAELSAPKTNVFISIPRMLRPEEMKEDAYEWRPAHWLHSAVFFGLSPTHFEQAKYYKDEKMRKDAKTAHSWQKLSRSRNILFKRPRPVVVKKKPAILIGFHWLETGGAEKLAFDTVEMALAAGLKVFIVSELGGPQRLKNKLPNSPDIHFVRVDQYLEKNHWGQFLENLIRRENIQLIHIHHCNGLYANLAHIKGTFPDIRVVDSTHIIEYFDGGYPRISGVWSNYIDTHHVISHELRMHFENNFQAGNKVLFGRLLEESKPKGKLIPFRMECGQTSYNIAFVGRMTHQKRPFLMIDIMRKLKKWAKETGITLTFDIVGEGPYKAAFDNLIIRKELDDVATSHPANADVHSILKKSDLLLLPSANEGLALVCYEAVEAGAIPISTDVGGQSELMPDGLLVPHSPISCVNETVALVERLINDDKFLAECKGEVIQKFNIICAEPKACDVLMEIYQETALMGSNR